MFNFLRNRQTISHSSCIIFHYHPHCMRVPTSLHTCQDLWCSFKKKISSTPGRCEVVSHCGFGLHFPDDYCCWAPFYDFPFVCVLWRNIYSCPLPVFNWVVCLSAVELWLISLHTLDIKLWSDMGFASIFSHSVGCLFTLLVVSFDAQQLLKFWWMPIYLFLPFVTCGFSVIFNLHSSWVMLLLG